MMRSDSGVSSEYNPRLRERLSLRVRAACGRSHLATRYRHGFLMSATLPFHAFQEVAHRWRVLAERRCEHFLELHDSGRWRYYYSEQHFLDRLDEAIRLSERWAEIAPLATAEDRAPELSDPVRRTAA